MSSFRSLQTIKRRSAGSYVNGFFVDGATSTMQIMASVQPANRRINEQMIPLPTGRRVDDFIEVFTDVNLQVLQEGSGIQPDILVWRGNEYECMGVEVWQSNVINHYVYLFSKVTQ